MLKYILFVAFVIALFAFGKTQQQITDYRIITNGNVGGMEREISRYISMGYQPIGGVTVVGDGLVQVIVK